MCINESLADTIISGLGAVIGLDIQHKQQKPDLFVNVTSVWSKVYKHNQSYQNKMGLCDVCTYIIIVIHGSSEEVL